MSLSESLTRLLQTLVCCLRRARSASRTKPVPKAVPGRGRSAESVDESETGSANFWSKGDDETAPTIGRPVRLCRPAVCIVAREQDAPTASLYRSRRDLLHLGGPARSLRLG